MHLREMKPALPDQTLGGYAGPPCPACGYRRGHPVPAGRLVRRAREMRGLSAPQLLDESGVDKDTPGYHWFERHGKTLQPWAEPICRALGIEPQAVRSGDWEQVVRHANPPLQEKMP